MSDDLISRSDKREQEFRKTRIPERECCFAHVFRCICCGDWVDEALRSEDGSNICVGCVEEAGAI
jgi:hypothetical protein